MPREWAIFTEQQQQKNKLAFGFFSDRMLAGWWQSSEVHLMRNDGFKGASKNTTLG